jgi:hypothetical protein
MSSYTVTAVNGTRDWESKYGPMRSYTINLEGSDGQAAMNIELAQKQTTTPPSVGQSLEGTIDWDGKFGPKFKKEQGSFGGGGGAPAPSAPVGKRDPGQQDSIERQVALKSAVELVNTFVSVGNQKPDSNFTKTVLTGFFDHALALIQNTPTPTPTTSMPQVSEPEHDRPVGAKSTAVSPHDAALAELRTRYVKWSGDDPDAPAAWQNKLTSMGLETPQDADDTQLEELLKFVS